MFSDEPAHDLLGGLDLAHVLSDRFGERLLSVADPSRAFRAYHWEVLIFSFFQKLLINELVADIGRQRQVEYPFYCWKFSPQQL